MSGFKNFILRGNLVDFAVAVIIGTAFGKVVDAFTKWLTSYIPGVKNVFDEKTLGGQFLNALLTFLILAAVVYFFVVVPYTKAKEKFFPSEEEGAPADVALLEEIRDLLAAKA